MCVAGWSTFSRWTRTKTISNIRKRRETFFLSIYSRNWNTFIITWGNWSDVHIYISHHQSNWKKQKIGWTEIVNKNVLFTRLSSNPKIKQLFLWDSNSGAFGWDEISGRECHQSKNCRRVCLLFSVFYKIKFCAIVISERHRAWFTCAGDSKFERAYSL